MWNALLHNAPLQSMDLSMPWFTMTLKYYLVQSISTLEVPGFKCSLLTHVCCVTLHYIMLNYITLCYIMLHCMTLLYCCTSIHYTVLHSTAVYTICWPALVSPGRRWVVSVSCSPSHVSLRLSQRPPTLVSASHTLQTLSSTSVSTRHSFAVSGRSFDVATRGKSLESPHSQGVHISSFWAFTICKHCKCSNGDRKAG